MEWREPVPAPSIPPADVLAPVVPVLHVHPQELTRPFLAVTNICPGCFINPDGMRIIELSDQETALEIRYHPNITRGTVGFEPSRVVLRKFHFDRFQSALLGIAYGNFLSCVSSLCVLHFLLQALFQSVALPAAIDDVRFVG